jgi:uncharacterized protein YukE
MSLGAATVHFDTDLEANMKDFNQLVEDLKRMRDEIKLKIHLGAKDVQDEWSALEKRWHGFEKKADFERSTKDVSAALRGLGKELEKAFSRIRSALAKA